MTDQHAELFRIGLDGQGGLRPDVEAAPARWTHYRLEEEGAEWLAAQRRLPDDVAEALVVENARPRVFGFDGSLLIVLRGVNLNPGADPEDMVSVRLLVEGDRVITISPRRVFAIEDVRAKLVAGEGPSRPGGVLVAIVERLVERMRPVIDGMEDTVDDLHERLLKGGPDGLQRGLADLRHSITMLRRYMAPQRDALGQLQRVTGPLLTDGERDELHHATDLQIRYVEDLDLVRERATVLQDEIDNAATNRLNHNIYVLSVVAAVFLPLGLLTGLLGINVGGMPGVDSPIAFWVVCGLLGVIALFEIWFLRRRRML